MHHDIHQVLFDEAHIRDRVKDLGSAISERHAGSDLVVVALLKGGVVFLADLIRSITIPIKLDFAWASSYGAGTESSGDVRLRVFPDDDLSGKRVLVVDDILDTGRTLLQVRSRLESDLGATQTVAATAVE